jgi:hypothetical protein
MGILYITEYAQLMPAGAPAGQGQLPMEPPVVATQKVTFTTHAESAAFNASTRLVRVHTDSICSLSAGSDDLSSPHGGGADRIPRRARRF